MSVPAIAIFLPLVLLLAGLLWARSRKPALSSPIARRGAALLREVPDTEAARALLERWRNRAVRWRLSSAAPAIAGAILLGVALRQEVRLGVGDHPPWSDPILVGLLGSFLGAIAAELHWLRRPSGPRHAADLTPRDVVALVAPHARRRTAAIAALAAGIVVAGLAVLPTRALTPGVLALAVLAVVLVVQQRIAIRPRPLVPPDVRAADDAVRRFAARSVDDAGAGAALLLVAWQTAPLAAALGAAAWASVFIPAQLAALVTAALWWRRSAAHRLLPDVGAVLQQQAQEPVR